MRCGAFPSLDSSKDSPSMKRKTIFYTLLATALLGACTSREEKEMRTNALGYLQAMGDYHIDEAKPYCTRHTREITIPTLNFLMSQADTAFINSNRPSVFTIKKIVRLSDTTASIHYHKQTPIKSINDSLLLRYEEGRWLADVRLAPLPYMNNHKDRTLDSAAMLRQFHNIKDLKRIPVDSISLKRSTHTTGR